MASFLPYRSRQQMRKRLKHVEIPFQHNDSVYTIGAYSGSLIQSSTPHRFFSAMPAKVECAIKLCDNPFLCETSEQISTDFLTIDCERISKISRMHSVLLLIGNKRFWLSRLYAELQRPLFHTTREAMDG